MHRKGRSGGFRRDSACFSVQLTNAGWAITRCRSRASRSGGNGEDVVADDQSRLHERIERAIEVAGNRREQMQLPEVAGPPDQTLEDGALRGVAVVLERDEAIDRHEKSIEVRRSKKVQSE